MDKVGGQICPNHMDKQIVSAYKTNLLSVTHKIINSSFSLNINQYLYKYLTCFCHGNAVIPVIILTTFISNKIYVHHIQYTNIFKNLLNIVINNFLYF